MLDDFEFVPEFLEIEGTSEKEIFEIANQLGFEDSQCLNWGANKVIEKYSK